MPDLVARRLLELMRAQRRAEGERDSHARASAAWESASARLDDLNERIWHLAASGTEAPEELAAGVNATLEADPEDDLLFRRSVLLCVRRALGDTTHERLAEQTANRVALADERVRATLAAVETAQLRLRSEYPAATITAQPIEDETVTIHLHAERNANIA